MPVKKPSTTKKTIARSGLPVPVYSLTGRAAGTLSLPKQIFGQKVNKTLLVQAVRVYATNQKFLLAETKSRGEVKGSSAKIYRQKGTGRARHGSIRAPIFVGGGIVFGPKPRKVRLSLPKRMKTAALLSALSSKVADKSVIGLTGVDKSSGKTKEIAQLLKQLNLKFKEQKLKLGNILIVTGEKRDNIVRGARNIPGVDVLPVNLINAYEVLRHDMLLLEKEAVERLKK